MQAENVKSAQRVIEVLEYLSSEAREATVSDVARTLGYPLSSTSVLLSSLERLGYLQISPDRRTYSATLRVMLLGARLQSDLFGDHNVLGAMEGLRSKTQQTIMLGLRQGIHVRILVSLRSPRSSLRIPVGTLRPVCRSPIGKILLAALPEAEKVAIIRYANASAAEQDKVDLSLLLKELEAVQSQGWALTLGYPQNDRAAMAVAVPPLLDQPPLALNIGTRLSDLQDESIKAAYREELIQTSQMFGPYQ